MDLCSCVGLSFSRGDVMCSKIVQRLCWLCREGRWSWSQRWVEKEEGQRTQQWKNRIGYEFIMWAVPCMCTFAI